MTTFPPPEYAPDRSDLDPSASDNIKNVIPNANGYGPFKSLQPFTNALSSACRGAYFAKASDGTVNVFAGEATKLSNLNGMTWNDASGASAPYGLAADHSWSFTNLGDYVVAANLGDPLQIYQMGVSTDFADLGGSPPVVRYVWTESGHLGLGQASSAERTIYRSGLNNAAFHTLGDRGATSQEIPDMGRVQGAVRTEGGAFIFGDTAIKALVNQPGNQVGFSLTNYESARGTPAPLSIVSVGNMNFFAAEDGFYQLGQPSNPIGFEKIDKTFVDEVAELETVQGAADIRRRMIWWRYKSTAGLAYTDRLIGYHWPSKRWARVEINLEWIITLATAGYTLEQLASSLGYTNIDTMPYSLDSSLFKGGRPSFAGFDTSHKLGFFEGDALEATLDSADIPMGGEGKRIMVPGYRPMGDIASAYGKVLVSETFGGAKREGTEYPMNATGFIPSQISGRTARFRTRVPEAEPWNHYTGIEVPISRQAGRR